MAWEQRGNKRYCYTAHRDNGRVVKIYHGNGEPACRQEKDAALLKLLEKKTSNASNRKWILWTNWIGAWLSRPRSLS